MATTENTEEFHNSYHKSKGSGPDSNGSNNNTSNINSNDDDGWCEVEERPCDVTDTLLEEPNVTENVEKVLSFAPVEGNRPLGIFMDKDSEFLHFQTFTVVKLDLIKIEKYQFITVQYASGN